METFKRVLRFGALNYIRNGWLSVATTLVLALTLFIISVFALQNYVVHLTVNNVQGKLDMAVYINDSPSEADVAAFVAQVKAIQGVKQVIYLDKSQVLAEWNGMSVAQAIKSQVTAANNPLPRTVKIQATSPDLLDSIAAKIQAMSFDSNIQNISYKDNRPLIQQLTAQSNQATKNGFIVGGIFGLIAIMFVFNTIRVVIKFRQDEIGVMKLVGATDSFIRGPFYIEGALYGIIGALVALAAVYVYIRMDLANSSAISAISNGSLTPQLMATYVGHIWLIAAALIAVGVVVSLTCTWLSLARYMRRY